jgi:hypothetical protein
MFKLRLAQNILALTKNNKSLLFNALVYNVRNIKPIVPKLVTDNLPK